MRIGIIGAGFWGPNLIRNFYQMDGIELAVCDLDASKLARIRKEYRGITTTQHVEELLEDKEVAAIVIATPPGTHFELSRKALAAGKHVLVEKPISVSSAEALALIELAKRSSLVLMVGHTFEYNPAVLQLAELIRSGELGQIYYAYSTRLNLGQIRGDINAMWSLAPHDISILIFLLGEQPERVSARGKAFLQKETEDVVFMILEFPSGTIAEIHVSWLDPQKERALTIVGDKKMAVYDDIDSEAKLRIYDKGVSRAGPGKFGEYFVKLRSGDIHIPKIDLTEPLTLECQHFLDCIRTGSIPRTDGQNGLRVVQVLEAAQMSLKRDGALIQVSR